MSKFYLYYSFVSVLVFISASLVFFRLYGNTEGGVWAAIAATIAGQCFYLHSLYFSNKLQYYYRPKTLDHLHVFSFLVVLLGSTFSVWYIFIMVYKKIPLFAYEITPVFPCVFSFITGKWGLHMFTATKEYADILMTNYPPLFESV